MCYTDSWNRYGNLAELDLDQWDCNDDDDRDDQQDDAEDDEQCGALQRTARSGWHGSGWAEGRDLWRTLTLSFCTPVRLSQTMAQVALIIRSRMSRD